VLGEAVELIRRLLTGGTATHAGSTVRLDGGRLDFVPADALG
jgi:alkanesulfonate monooxygenase SsuD/methylene tetrahydromethanopterin reductase-like flavin-dependent oxidoreductase (luciferase family)